MKNSSKVLKQKKKPNKANSFREKIMIKKVRSHHQFMWGYLRALLQAFFRPATVFLIFLAVTIVVVGASGFYYFESGLNREINVFFDALYYIVTIVTGVGLGDIVPVTQPGRIISMCVMVIGTGIYVSLTAIVAVTILSLENSDRKF
jgi:hypothetical protein